MLAIGPSQIVYYIELHVSTASHHTKASRENINTSCLAAALLMIFGRSQISLCGDNGLDSLGAIQKSALSHHRPVQKSNFI